MKKALALILTLIMVLGLMPAAMAATDDPIRSVTKTENDLVINKSVNPNNDGSYALTIEAYATGTSSTTTQSVPLDIVLVLDVSGSMKETFSNDKQYIPQNSQDYTAWTIINSDTLYYKYTDNNYYPVDYDWDYNWDYNWTDGFKYVLYFYDSSNTVHYLTSNGELADSATYLPIDQTLYKGVLYKLTSPSKMNVLKTAVNNFIDTVAADASKNSVDHKIAIVKFAGTKKNEVGNDKYKEGQYSYNYSQTVVGLTDVSVSGNENTLKQKVSELTHGGATAADYGMQLAKGLLSKPQEGRKQIVVMFTDGEPNHGNGFDNSVANAAISAAKAMKDRKVTVYTIGAIQTPSNSVKQFLDYTSSNYPSAESMDNAGGKAADKYYKLVKTDTALAGIFETIASETTQTSAAANASSVLEDKLTGYFDFANLSGGNITEYTVKKAACIGENAWDAPADASGSVSVSVNGNDTIDITGFDYTSDDNLVVKKNNEWQGNKLIVTFNIVLDESAEGWHAGLNRVPTNANGFACIKGQDDQPLIALTESPEVDVYAYVVKYKVTGDVPESFTPNIPADKVYLAGKPVAVAEDLKTTVTSNNGQEGVWTFNGWKKGGEGIQTIQIPNGPAADYTITINGTWTFAPTEQFGLLTIAKNFGGNSAINANNWPEGKPLTFTIQKVNDDGTTAGTTGDPTTVTLPKDGKWTDTVQLAPGTYTVTESDSDADVDGYDLTVSNSTITEQTPTADGKTGTVTVTAGTTPATITFINTYTVDDPPFEEEGSLTIKKEFVFAEGEATEARPASIEFTVKQIVPEGQTGHSKTVTLTSDKWEETITVPVGKYTVTEVDAKIDGYTYTPVQNPTGNITVAANETAAVTFTNTYKKLPPDIAEQVFNVTKKVVQGGNVAPGKNTFNFEFRILEDTPIVAARAALPNVPGYTVTVDGTKITPDESGLYHFTIAVNGAAEKTAVVRVTGNKDMVEKITALKIWETGTVPTYWVYDNGADGKEVDIGDSVTFTNTYTYNPTPGPSYPPYNPPVHQDPVPPIVIPPKTGDMTIWQSILNFLGIR